MTLVIRSELAVTRKTKDTRLGASGGTGCVAFQSDKRETTKIIYKNKFLYGGQELIYCKDNSVSTSYSCEIIKV